MVTGERLTITITGGAPWGFRLFGGENFPLEVAKVGGILFLLFCYSVVYDSANMSQVM